MPQATRSMAPGRTTIRRRADDPLLQLNPPVPLDIPKGEGFAHFLIDYGPESDL